ncbi:metallophosphoesterase family protein [Microvirga aerilata]|uniref:Metallophosphoesterase family protein n=1 Tax=Microvirga aerilata TaxID=670292 RepID=A0A936ZBL9_9HYPH|nr:metallophosphoesterase family protein [Microvirga aerilata]MBL0403992.1 metallophosphoesterase family protein [Microvirga aerilata]
MRIAVIADIHGNLIALEAVLADIAREKPDLTVDLGDCVSGPLWPRETIELLATLKLPTVRGNHDRQVATLAPSTMGASDRFAYGELDVRHLEHLKALPPSLWVAPDVLAFHATPHRDDVYLTDAVVDGRLVRAGIADIEKHLGQTTARVILCGHSHRPDAVRLGNGALIVNPGSVGCPAYDDPVHPAHVSEAGTPHARYAIIDMRSNAAVNVAFKALNYPHEAAAQRAEANGRPEWAHALRTGMTLHSVE